MSRWTVNIAFRPRSGDLILMNAGLAKAIRGIWFIPDRPLISVKRPLQRRIERPGILTVVSATMARRSSAMTLAVIPERFLCDAQFPDLTGGAFADQCERPPDRRIGIPRRGGVSQIAKRRLTQRLGAAGFWIGFENFECRCREPGRSFGINRPVRHQKRPCAGIEERPRETRQASAPGLSPAIVLQADSTTQSALSFSCATSLAVRRPSSKSDDCLGMLSTSDGSARPFTSPAMRP